MKRKHIILLFVLCLSGWLASLDTGTSSEKKPPSKSANEFSGTKQKSSDKEAKRQSRELTNISQVQERKSLIGSQEFKKKQHDLFALKDDDNTTSVKPSTEPMAPLPNPTAPELPFKYLGNKLENGNLEVYLEINQEIFIAKEKAVFHGTYRIDRIELPKISITYLPLNLVQIFTIPN